MSEIDILEKYKSGEIKGVLATETCFYMPVRITGLGITKRIDIEATQKALNEALNADETSLEALKDLAKEKGLNISDYVKEYEIDRRPQEFCTDEALARFASIPILKDHPHDKDGNATLLTFENLSENPIIGTTISAYEKDNGIWGIAKIFDLSLLDSLENQYKSTSPAVSSLNLCYNNKTFESLNEVNHLAFVEQGHWDCKGGEAYDFSNLQVIKGDEAMAKELENADNEVETGDKTETEVLDNVVEQTDSDNEKLPLLGKADSDDESDDEVADESDDEKADSGKSYEEIIAELNALDADLNIDECKTKDDDETIESESETADDEATQEIADNFKDMCDEVGSIVKLKRPVRDKRYTPTAYILKILRGNSNFVDSKYSGVLWGENKGSANLQILVDAYNSMQDNIKNEFNKARSANKKGSWELTDNPNVKINRDF